MRVGFVGLGDQGSPMARRIVQGGHECHIWARRQATIESFRTEPVEIAASLVDLGASVDLLETCVFDAAGTNEVLFGTNGAAFGMKRGSIIAIHSTMSPHEVQQLASQAADLGVHLLDAPVSGGRVLAERGELVTMIGGDAAVLERCRSIFSTFARTIVRVGDVGAGQQAKLINNAIYTAQIALAVDGFEIGAQLGLDRAGLAEVLCKGSSRCVGNDVVAAMPSLKEQANSRARPTLSKDIRLLASLLSDESPKAKEPSSRPSMLETAEGLIRRWDVVSSGGVTHQD